MTQEERFWSKVEKTATCWLWRGRNGHRRYGSAHWDGRNIGAHRVAYQLEHGPIPDGMVLDHLCRVPLCVNPSHLEVVTQLENVRRGPLASQKECKRGHSLTDPANLTPWGLRINRRQCWECVRTYGQRRREAVAS